MALLRRTRFSWKPADSIVKITIRDVQSMGSRVRTAISEVETFGPLHPWQRGKELKHLPDKGHAISGLCHRVRHPGLFQRVNLDVAEEHFSAFGLEEDFAAGWER